MVKFYFCNHMLRPKRTECDWLWGIYRGSPHLAVTISPFDHHLLHFYSQSMSVIVVGGGLAGLSAAHTLLERGASVLMLDKQGYVVCLR